ncbi:HTH domain-containing protein [Prosthecobacter sp. SYSU 5D2]|uniref:HTH domain-containing protein n=1 Tax=Prosthecobacter sp. SYSU 5D2 TaxID=3134134 RepID=UPI0031FE449A
MDSLISAAASALAAGDPLRALNWVALREDAAALALRGIAMAQLGDLAQAQILLKWAARAFGPQQAIAHARCMVAQAEIALVSRDLGWPVKALAAAQAALEQNGDVINAIHARHLQARRALLLGRLDEAERVMKDADAVSLPPARRAAHEMILAGMAMQRLRIAPARAAFSRAREAARLSCIPALQAEVEAAARRLDTPSARCITGQQERPVLLEDVEALFTSGALVVDACRRVVRRGRMGIPMATRPVLFALVRSLAEAWPNDVCRTDLLRAGFQAKRVDESHRARLRVEIGRLRQLLRPLADVQATRSGFALQLRQGAEVTVLAWPVEEEHGSILAFLSDGEAWSSSALALALGVSQRTVQRALDVLAADGKVQWFGRARARRWTTSVVPGFTTIMLLPTLLHDG